MKSHKLKTWPAPFDAVASGAKTYEVRVNDRGFAVGDELVLEEWDMAVGYTGRVMLARVRYITPGGSFGLPESLCVMSIKVTQ